MISPPRSPLTWPRCESGESSDSAISKRRTTATGVTPGILFKGRSDIDIAVNVLRKSADVIVPALTSFEHYSKWLEQHPVKYISPTERLQEK